jgi:lysophospholipase L1-like esterase
MKKLLLSYFLCHGMIAVSAQTNLPVVIAVVGSSTAAGTGPADPQKAFVNRYRTYLKSLNSASEVFNVAVGGSTSYHCNPAWFNPGPTRPAPIYARSISRAVNPDNGFRKPDAIIISLPTNDGASAFTLAETRANFERMVATADSLHIPVWVTTSQPRNDLPQSQVNLLLALRDWVLPHFGAKALDFWTDIAGPDNLIKPQLRTGDLVHLNDSAHGILFDRVVNARLLDTIAKGPVRYGYFTAARQGQAALLQWESHRERYMQRYIIERSTDSINWTAVGHVNANGSTITPHLYSFTDAAAPAGPIYYRLCMEDIYARRFYTGGKKIGGGSPQPPLTNSTITVAVIGSSTAANQGPADPQKSFANRYRTHLQSLNSASDVYNIAIPWGSSTTFHCNPGWYVPGPWRAAPDASANITRALHPAGGYRKPDAIIVCLPSNDAASDIPLAETQANFERIFSAADSLHVPVWITSSQPRNDLSQAQINTLLAQQTWVMQRFGPYAVDFWTGIAGPDNLIKPSLRTVFNNGTGLNDSAHGILYQRILDEYILDTLAKGPVRFAQLGVSAKDQGARIQWESHRERYMQQYIVERSSDSLTWQAIDTVAANGSTIAPNQYSSTDGTMLTGAVYYRLCMEDTYTRKFYTGGVKFTPIGPLKVAPVPTQSGNEAGKAQVYPNPAGQSFRVRGLSPGTHLLQVFNNMGQLVYEDRGYENEKEVAQHWLSGAYYLVIDGGKQKVSLLRM